MRGEGRRLQRAVMGKGNRQGRQDTIGVALRGKGRAPDKKGETPGGGGGPYRTESGGELKGIGAGVGGGSRARE